MVNNLMFEDAKKPCFFRGMALEPVFGFHSSQKGFLNQVLGNGDISDSLQSKSKKNITVLIDPDFRVQ
jgi:hypothetical protein